MLIFTHMKIIENIWGSVAKSSTPHDDPLFLEEPTQQEDVKRQPDAHMEGSLGWDSGGVA